MSNADDADAVNDQEHRDSPPPPPIIPPYNETVLPNPEHNRPESHINVTVDFPNKTRTIEWIQLGISVVLAVIGVVAICIYGGELNVMRGQLRQMIKQYPTLKESADAAHSAATTASATLDVSQQQFRNEQRPYVWLDAGVATSAAVVTDTPLSSLLQSHLSLVVNIRLTNGGHSPAIEIINTPAATIIDSPQEAIKKVREYRPNYLGAGGFLAPNSSSVTSSKAIELNENLLEKLSRL